MFVGAIVAVCAVAVAPALAVVPADWTLVATPVIDSTTTPYDTSANGVGSPSVEWDPITNQFIMVFEYKTDIVSALCTGGVWGLGIARSPDNVTWTVDANPLYVPTPGDGTYYSCVTAHPAVMWSENSIDGTAGDDLRVYFKAQQGTDACLAGTPSWGCNTYTGVGDILVELDAAGLVENIDIAPVPDVYMDQEFGYGNVIQRGSDGKYVMLLQQKALETSRRWDIYALSSFDERSGWGSAYKVMQPSTAISWASNELYTPTLMCMPQVGANFPLRAFIAGHTYTGAAITSAGWAVTNNNNGLGYLWTVPGAPQFSWTNGDEWKHLDGLRIGPDEYMIWFAEKNTATGKIQIRTGSTTNNVFTSADVVDRRCN